MIFFLKQDLRMQNPSTEKTDGGKDNETFNTALFVLQKKIQYRPFSYIGRRQLPQALYSYGNQDNYPIPRTMYMYVYKGS